MVAGVSVGEAQRPTTIAIMAVSGTIEEPVFECASIHRFKTSTPIRSICGGIARRLDLGVLREAFPAFSAAEFNGKKPSIAIDATLIGEHVFFEFQRLK